MSHVFELISSFHRYLLIKERTAYMYGLRQCGIHTRTIVLLDHENASTETKCVKMPYRLLYDYSYFRKECFWEKQPKTIF